MGLEAVERQVERLSASDRELVEEGLASVAELMVEAGPAAVAEITDGLQRRSPANEEPAGASLEVRNLLRVFEDWQRVRDESVSTAELARHGVNRQVLLQWRKAHKLLALNVPFKREVLYPVWQFGDNGQPLEVVRSLLEAAQEARLSPTDLHFFMTRIPSDGTTMADRLQTGAVDDVLAAVRASGAHGG
jgi:hypothetical protein